MKNTVRMMMTVAALLVTTHFACAAAKANEDGSQLTIWIFLGMCALIVVAQLSLHGSRTAEGLAQGKKKQAEVQPEVVIHK